MITSSSNDILVCCIILSPIIEPLFGCIIPCIQPKCINVPYLYRSSKARTSHATITTRTTTIKFFFILFDHIIKAYWTINCPLYIIMLQPKTILSSSFVVNVILLIPGFNRVFIFFEGIQKELAHVY